MHVYLASRFENRARLRECRVVLEGYRHVVTSRWLDVACRPTPAEDSPEWADHAAEWSQYDLEDIDASDLLICDLDCELEGMRGGVHVEVGYALALGKQVWVIGRRPNVFYFHPGVKFLPNWTAVWRAIGWASNEA